MQGTSQGWPVVMGRFMFLGSKELSRHAYQSLGQNLSDVEKAVMLEYLQLPIPLELRRKFEDTEFQDLVAARGRVIEKLKVFFQV